MLMAALLLLQAAPSIDGSRVAVEMKPRRTYEGVWFDIFEAQQFVDRGRDGDAHLDRDAPWIAIDRSSALKSYPDFRRDLTTPRRYRIRFLGREARDMDCHRKDSGLASGCYGHEGAFSGMVVADRILSIAYIGRLAATPPR
jgi:hypothetical protein